MENESRIARNPALSAVFLARDVPARKTPGSVAWMMGLLFRERLAGVRGPFYFLTFSGFVAFSICLPLLLRDQFERTSGDAGIRNACRS